MKTDIMLMILEKEADDSILLILIQLDLVLA
jgi:hypothetical protein